MEEEDSNRHVANHGDAAAETKVDLFSPEVFFRNEEKPFPDQIEVVGAGEDAVNGVYVRGESTAALDPCYVKKGVWDGESVEFRVGLFNHDSFWYLDRLNPDGTTPIMYERQFDENMDMSKEVPQLGWELGDINEEPVPVILYGNRIPLDWRLDPQRSRSDWTIRISANEGNGQVKIKDYNVHLNIITMGDRASGYFIRACDKERFAESKAKMSCIDLHPLAANAFPVMLDYMYGRNLRDEADKIAVPLIFLARYFDCGELLREVNVCCQSYLSINVSTFYDDAVDLKLFDIIPVIEAHCVKNPISLQRHNFASPSFWVSVFSKVTMTPEASKSLSVVLSGLCRRKEDDVDKAMLLQLSDKLTHVCIREATTLLEAEMRLRKNVKVGRKRGRDESLTHLQTICLTALAKKFGVPGFEHCVKLPEGSPANLYSHLLELAKASVINRVNELEDAVAAAEARM
jgi:hypothetical protein